MGGEEAESPFLRPLLSGDDLECQHTMQSRHEKLTQVLPGKIAGAQSSA